MPRKPKQQSFFKKQNQSTDFGGTKLKGNPRGKRHLHKKKALHLVLKSSLCKGGFSLLQKKYARRVQATIFKYAKKYGIRVYHYQNVGNHLHFVLRCPNSILYTKFIRATSGRIAQALLKDMGHPKCTGGDPTDTGQNKRPEKFWDYRPFSRTITWGKGFEYMKDYILKNTLDVLGLPRSKENLAELKSIFQMLKRKEPPADLDPPNQMEFQFA
jgi:REP element-mobilizing transposase RayT